MNCTSVFFKVFFNIKSKLEKKNKQIQVKRLTTKREEKMKQQLKDRRKERFGSHLLFVLFKYR